jgi:hypothetical protein
VSRRHPVPLPRRRGVRPAADAGAGRARGPRMPCRGFGPTVCYRSHLRITDNSAIATAT